MRTVLLLLMAIFAIDTASAQSQGGPCSQSYITCLDKCVGRPSQALQETCMESCQTQNNVCSSKLYGGVNMSTAKSVPAEETQAQDAKPGDTAKPKRGAQQSKPAKRSADAKAQAKPPAPEKEMDAPADTERRTQ